MFLALCPWQGFAQREANNPKRQKQQTVCFFLSCFASLLCCVSLSLCFTFFLLFLLYLPDCFFVICQFFTHLVFLFLPPFPLNCKAAEEGKRDDEWKKTKIKQHEKQKTRQIRANRRWREINKHKPPPPPPIHRKVESTNKIKKGVDAEVQMRHSCVIGPETLRNCGNKCFWLERMLSLWTSETLPKNKWRVDHNIRFFEGGALWFTSFLGTSFSVLVVMLFLSLFFVVRLLWFSFVVVVVCYLFLLLLLVVGWLVGWLVVVVVLLLFCCRLFITVVVLLLLLLFRFYSCIVFCCLVVLLSCFRSFVLVIVLVVSLPKNTPTNKKKNNKKPLFHSVFGPLSLARFRPERGQQPKTTKTTNGLFFSFLFCFSSLLCFFIFVFHVFLAIPPLSPWLFFVICQFFTHLVFLFLPPFPLNCKAAEEGKKRRWMKKNENKTTWKAKNQTDKSK